MTLLKLAAGLAALYLVLVGLMALAQDRLIFPRWAMPPGSPALPAEAERLTIALPDGNRLAGVRLPAVAPPPEGAALLLGFGGNAWDAHALALFLRSVLPERDVVAFHYRGYGPSTGRPSAAALEADAVAIHDHLAAAGAARIVPVGLSLGAGPAAHLASRRPVAGLVLVTPFDSLGALARDHYPWAPVRLLLRHRMEVAAALEATRAPVALIAAGRDTIIPPRRTEPLRHTGAAIVLDRTIEDAGHNDLYDHPAFAAALREAVARIEAAPPG